MKYTIAGLLLATACSHSDATDKAQPAAAPAHPSAAADDDTEFTLDCAADISSDDIKGLLAAPFKTETLNADRDRNGCSFQTVHYAAVRVYLSNDGADEPVYTMAQKSGNIAPLAGVGDRALRGTSAFTNVVAVKRHAECTIDLAGVGNVDGEADLVKQSQEIREQKLGAICAKLFAAKKV